LDLACIQTRQRLLGDTTFYRNERLEVEDSDLAHLSTVNACIASQRAEDIAGTQFLFSTGTDAQGYHRRLQGLTRLRLEAVERMPVQRSLLPFLDGSCTVGFCRRHQADRDTVLA